MQSVREINMRFATLFSLIFLSLSLSACSSSRVASGVAGGAGSSYSGSATGGNYKVGQPYQIQGMWYYPKADYDYDETGIASWYGDDFHGKLTANGEIYNKNELTAAHQTLPMPSLVRVTNLDNGKSIVVRINDRGPYANGRIIDMSQRGAQLLGFEKQGTAKVRVQILAEESQAIADASKRMGSRAASEQMQENIPQQAPVDSVQVEPLPNNNIGAVESKPIYPEQTVQQVPVSGTGQIYVQAGAFTMKENAIKLQQKLSSLGNVQMTQVKVNGIDFYRVRIPAGSVDQADRVLQNALKAGVQSPRIVVD
jgi:rare lipoprotein A